MAATRSRRCRAASAASAVERAAWRRGHGNRRWTSERRRLHTGRARPPQGGRIDLRGVWLNARGVGNGGALAPLGSGSGKLRRTRFCALFARARFRPRRPRAAFARLGCGGSADDSPTATPVRPLANSRRCSAPASSSARRATAPTFPISAPPIVATRARSAIRPPARSRRQTRRLCPRPCTFWRSRSNSRRSTASVVKRARRLFARSRTAFADLIATKPFVPSRLERPIP